MCFFNWIQPFIERRHKIKHFFFIKLIYKHKKINVKSSSSIRFIYIPVHSWNECWVHQNLRLCIHFWRRLRIVISHLILLICRCIKTQVLFNNYIKKVICKYSLNVHSCFNFKLKKLSKYSSGLIFN